MKTKHFLLMLVALFIAVGASASISGTAALQTRRRLTSEQRAKIRENAREKAIQDSLAEVARQDSIMRARQARRERIDRARVRNASRGAIGNAANGSSETEETADVDVSGKVGETTKTTVSKSTTQPTQTTVNELNKEKEASNAKEGAYGRASRPSTSNSTSNNQQATGSRPSSSTSSSSGSRPSSSTSSSSGSRPSSSTSSSSGSRPSSSTSSSTGSRPSSSAGNNNSGSRSSDNKQSDSKRGGVKGRSDDSNTDIDIHGNAVTRQKAYEEGFSYFRSMDNITSLTVPAISEANLPTVIQSNGKAYILTKETHDARNTSDDFFVTNYENIYPGAIVWADQSLAEGDPTLVGLAPGAVTLRVDFNTGGRSSVSGVTNSADQVQDAIYRLVREARYQPAASFNYKSFYSSSAEEMAVSMKANLKFLNNKANINTSFSQRETHIYEVQDFTQRYYTVSITQESDKSKYFEDNLPWSKVSAKLGERNYSVPMAIITSVTYGRRAYKIYKYSTKDFKFSGDESVKLYGQSLGSTQDIARNSETKDIWMYLDGGDVDSNGAILSGTAIDQALANKLAYNASTSQGVPIAYTVRFLATGKTASVSTTGSYTTYSYQELPTIISVTLRNNATHVAGAGLKMRLDYKVFTFDADGNKVELPRENNDVYRGYTRYYESNYGFGDTKTFNLNLNPGEFLDGPIHFQVRCKKTSSANWDNDVECSILPDQKGIIDVDIHGAIRPDGTRAYIHSSSYTKKINDQ